MHVEITNIVKLRIHSVGGVDQSNAQWKVLLE